MQTDDSQMTNTRTHARTHTHKALTSAVATQLTRMKLVSATYLYTNSKSREMPPREVLLLRTFRQRALKQGERNLQLSSAAQSDAKVYVPDLTVRCR